MKRGQNKQSGQLCWDCKKACGYCNWSRSLEPVKGWTAEKVTRKSGNTSYETYHISACPEFEKDGDDYYVLPIHEED